MEIGLIYSNKDPKQVATRNFVRNYIKERGILAHLVETEKEVDCPAISIDGCSISKGKNSPKTKSRFPKLADIAKAIEQNVWSL
ncbi:MAG: hypothetical protein U9N54_10925 [candidate division Zixibacteria bacterium]|nr:hypothetical protein [candidate division Zixibacteria bacterium]